MNEITRQVIAILVSILFLVNSSFAKPSDAEAKHEGFVEFLCECKTSNDAAKCFAIALDELRHNKYMDAKTKMELHKKAIEELKKSLADIEAKQLEGSVDYHPMDLYAGGLSYFSDSELSKYLRRKMDEGFTLEEAAKTVCPDCKDIWAWLEEEGVLIGIQNRIRKIPEAMSNSGNAS